MNFRDCTECFAVPGEDSVIDMRHPVTGLSMVNGETLEQVQARYPAAVVIAWETWRAEKAARQNQPVEWRECSEARYMDMLEVLPPAHMEPRGFLVGEPWDHDAATGRPRFAAFRHTRLAYLESSRPMTVVEFRAVLAGGA